jgi:hypothetical protein
MKRADRGCIGGGVRFSGPKRCARHPEQDQQQDQNNRQRGMNGGGRGNADGDAYGYGAQPFRLFSFSPRAGRRDT